MLAFNIKTYLKKEIWPGKWPFPGIQNNLNTQISDNVFDLFAVEDI